MHPTPSRRFHILLSSLGLSAGLTAGINPAPAQVAFSHDLLTVGAAGSTVNAVPNEASLYNGGGGTNTGVAIPAALGLVMGDNIDALDRDGFVPLVFGELVTPFLFSVAPGATGLAGTPIRGEIPSNAADVYALGTVPGHTLAMQEGVNGLATNAIDSIDGMTETGLLPGERVFLSLVSGSPTLVANGWSGADVLTAVIGSPGSLRLAIRADQLGLQVTDDLDALAVETPQDANGDGSFFGPTDTANVYFSVGVGSSGLPGTDVRARATALSANQDIYLSGISGTNTLLYPGERWTKIAATDVVDAIKRGSLDPADPFPLMVPAVPRLPPMQPPNEPPYRGIGVPIGAVYVQVCDMTLASITNWSLELKLCDAQGNSMSVIFDGSIAGLGGANGIQKALIIQAIFSAAFIDKAACGPDPIPIFSNVAINIPSTRVNNPNIVAEVCAVVNQDFVDCGWDLDAVCFSMTNWTAGIVLEPVLGAFFGAERQSTYAVDEIPEQGGVFGISAGDFSNPNQPLNVRYEVPFKPGQPPFAIAQTLADLIISEGGDAAVDPDGRIRIRSLPVEHGASSLGVVGPLVYEGGALDNPVPVSFTAALGRTKDAPCGAADYAAPFGELNILDVVAFITAWNDGSLQTDYAEPAGELNILDVVEFIQLWNKGCPVDNF